MQFKNKSRQQNAICFPTEFSGQSMFNLNEDNAHILGRFLNYMLKIKSFNSVFKSDT